MSDKVRISLDLTLRSSAHCGGCQFELAGCGFCGIWQKQGQRGPSISGSKGGSEYLRLPECIAAGESSNSVDAMAKDQQASATQAVRYQDEAFELRARVAKLERLLGGSGLLP
jgi:hypothetical protein